jgi:hypothetical protein
MYFMVKEKSILQLENLTAKCAGSSYRGSIKCHNSLKTKEMIRSRKSGMVYQFDDSVMLNLVQHLAFRP